MHEEKLGDMYSRASKKKLSDMWKLSDDYDAKASVLETKATSIRTNIKATIAAKFAGGIDKEVLDKAGDKQIKEMSKQWVLMAASMVKVKRSIQLKGFHTKLNLYAHPRYGIKEHKRYSGYHPFGWIDLQRQSSYSEAPFSISLDKTRLIMGSEDYLDFKKLDGIPQLDEERVEMFAGLTYELIGMVDSWLKFFGSTDRRRRDDISLISRLADKYRGVDSNEYLNVIGRLDKLIKVKENFMADIVKQSEKWEPTIKKWQDRNKNFVVLAELAKIDLKL